MSSSKEEVEFQWTSQAIAQSIAIFCLAGIAEIFGGYLVWAAVKGLRVETSSVDDADVDAESEANTNDIVDGNSQNGFDIVKKPWWYALIGSFVLM